MNHHPYQICDLVFQDSKAYQNFATLQIFPTTTFALLPDTFCYQRKLDKRINLRFQERSTNRTGNSNQQTQ
jgi:hypothetical protein